MNWYLDGNDLLRNTYVEPAGAPNAGGSGNRDFSKNRVTPAPASSFEVPKGCPEPEKGERAFENVLPLWWSMTITAQTYGLDILVAAT